MGKLRKLMYLLGIGVSQTSCPLDVEHTRKAFKDEDLETRVRALEVRVSLIKRRQQESRHAQHRPA